VVIMVMMVVIITCMTMMIMVVVMAIATQHSNVRKAHETSNPPPSCHQAQPPLQALQRRCLASPPPFGIISPTKLLPPPRRPPPPLLPAAQHCGGKDTIVLAHSLLPHQFCESSARVHRAPATPVSHASCRSVAGVLAEEIVSGWVEAKYGARKESECQYAVPQLVGAFDEGGDEDRRPTLAAGDGGGAGTLRGGTAGSVWWEVGGGRWEVGGGGCMTEFEA
jgi:hypothetical protein